MSIKFGRSTPILRVTDMGRSVEYFIRVLGFEREWGDQVFASLRRGEAVLMLAAGDQGRGGAWLYVGVEDVDTLCEEIQPRGAVIRLGPANYPWGARELHVEDPDGNVIRFGSGATDGPIGEWLDDQGVRWIHSLESGWTRRRE